MRWFLLVGLMGCAAETSLDDGAVWVDDAQAGPPLAAGYLEFGVNALDVGEQLQLVVRGARAGDTVQFFRGTGFGQGACPGALGGLCAQLTGQVRRIGSVIANNQGNAVLTLNMPAAPIGADVYMQAVVGGGNPAVSEVQRRLVRPAGSADPYAIGPNYQLPGQSWVSQDALLLHPVEITEASEVVGFSCLGRVAGPNFRNALYDDAGGAPGQLIARNAPTPLSVQQTTSPLVNGPVAVQPGRYWLGEMYEGPAETYSNTLLAAPEYVLLTPFSQPLPAQFAGGNFYQSYRLNCSLIVR